MLAVKNNSLLAVVVAVFSFLSSASNNYAVSAENLVSTVQDLTAVAENQPFEVDMTQVVAVAVQFQMMDEGCDCADESDTLALIAREALVRAGLVVPEENPFGQYISMDGNVVNAENEHDVEVLQDTTLETHIQALGMIEERLHKSRIKRENLKNKILQKKQKEKQQQPKGPTNRRHLLVTDVIAKSKEKQGRRRLGCYGDEYCCIMCQHGFPQWCECAGEGGRRNRNLRETTTTAARNLISVRISSEEDVEALKAFVVVKVKELLAGYKQKQDLGCLSFDEEEGFTVTVGIMAEF